MVDYLYGPVQHDAFFRKYASKKFLKGMCCPFFSSLLALTIVSLLVPSYHKHHPTNLLSASIVLRQWAKKFAPMYLDTIASNGGDTPQI